MIELSIIIVSYNVKSFLITCLNSIYKNGKDLSLEVILVDNASKDGSAYEVKKTFKDVKVIENTVNKGFPAANNQVIEMAKGKYVLLLNPDTEIHNNALQEMIGYMNMHSDIEVLGPKLLNTNGSLQYSFWRFPTLWNVTAEMFYLHKIFRHKYYPEQKLTAPFEVDSLSGAALLFRSELISKIGALDEQLFWIEDVDFCYRVKKAGGKVVYYPLAAITHHTGQSGKKDYKISLSNQVVNKIKFFKKHYSKAAWLAVTVTSLVHCIYKLIAFMVLSPFNAIAAKKTKAYWYVLPRIFNPPKGIT